MTTARVKPPGELVQANAFAAVVGAGRENFRLRLAPARIPSGLTRRDQPSGARLDEMLYRLATQF